MVGHLFQNYDTIYVWFFATYTCNRSCSVGFFPKYVSIFFSYIRSTQTYVKQTRMYLRTTRAHIHVLQTSMCIWGHSRSSYKRHRIIPPAINLLHVPWRWKVTSDWIKLGHNGRVNFGQGLVLIHCPHSSGGCWLPNNEFVGICGLSLERLWTLLPKCWPKHGRKLNCTTPGYDRFSSGIARFLGSRWGRKYGENPGSWKPGNTATDLNK